MTLTQIKPAGLSKPVDLADNERIRLGTGNDLEIYHSGSHSYIQDNGTGALYIGSGGGGIYIRGQHGEDSIIANSNGSVELYYDNVKKLETAADRVNVTGHIFISDGNLYIKNGFNDANSRIRNTGGSTDANLEFLVRSSGTETEALEITSTSHIRIPNDGKQLRFGASDDLIIYHNGSDSYIDENGTGDLKIRSTSGIQLQNGSEKYIACHPNGAVELYHDNSKKFETTSNGAKLTSTAATLRLASSTDHQRASLEMTSSGTEAQVGKISYDHTNSAIVSGYLEAFLIDGTETNLAVKVDGAIKIPDSGTKNATLLIGEGNDLQIYHNGSNSYIDNHTGDLNIRGDGDDIILKPVDTEVALKAIPNGAVELYYDNVKTFETTAEGVKFDTGSSSCVVRLNSNTDAEALFQAFNSDLIIKPASGGGCFINANSTESAIHCIANGAVELYHNGNRQVFTIDGGMNWQDNKKAEFGNSGDLKIYHDGSNSYIQDTGTGDMRLTGSTIRLKSSSTTEDMLVCHENNRVDLFYNNVKTARTIKTGNTNGFLAGSDSYINDSIDHGEFIVRKDLASPAQPSITQCARATIITNERTAGVNGYGGALFFGGQDVDTNDQYTVDLAAIGATTNGNDIGNANASGFLDFYTRNGGTFGHKFRIEQDGDLLGTDTSIGSLSDSRLKENIEDFTFDINKFKQFQPKLFNWKHPEYHRDTPASGKHRGFIAQDLEVIDSELVTTYRIPKENPESALVDQVTLETEEYKEVVAEGKTSNLGRIDAMYISVINQLIAKVEALETKVAVLEAK